VPLAFALPSLLGLLVVLKCTSPTSPARNAQLALFGGAALFFITLIFPIQFDRQWITVGWALEGAALCWLFHRVPHPGLRLTGVVLLVVIFARLALNPTVLSYHPHAAFPILNWYLYTYGLATVCLFAAGRFLAPPRQFVLGSNVLPLLYTLGTVLAFLIVNIEIADYFSAPGATALTFAWSHCRETFLSRSFATRPTLSYQRVRSGRYHRDGRVIPVSAIPRCRGQSQRNQIYAYIGSVALASSPDRQRYFLRSC
jgi:uncharacterized membrane protein